MTDIELARATVLRLERANREAAHLFELDEALTAQKAVLRMRAKLGMPAVLAAGRVQWVTDDPHPLDRETCAHCGDPECVFNDCLDTRASQ